MGRFVLVEVQYPLHTGCEVVGSDVRFLVAVDVYPLYTLTDVEGPVQTVILCSPLIGQARNDLAFVVYFEQRVGEVGQVLQIVEALAVEDIEGLDFTGSQFRDNQIGNLVAGALGAFRFIAGALGCLLGAVVAAGGSFIIGRGTACSQQERGCQRQSKDF